MSAGGVQGSLPGGKSLSQEQLEHSRWFPRVCVSNRHCGVDGWWREDPGGSPCSQVAQDTTPPQVWRTSWFFVVVLFYVATIIVMILLQGT